MILGAAQIETARHLVDSCKSAVAAQENREVLEWDFYTTQRRWGMFKPFSQTKKKEQNWKGLIHLCIKTQRNWCCEDNQSVHLQPTCSNHLSQNRFCCLSKTCKSTKCCDAKVTVMIFSHAVWEDFVVQSCSTIKLRKKRDGMHTSDILLWLWKVFNLLCSGSTSLTSP